MAASMADSSSSKSAVSGTPTKFSPRSCADIWYITKPGSGASNVAPGLLQATERMSISSSEPLPRISWQPVGRSTNFDSAATTSAVLCTG
jgi:hypothetical protein